MPLSLDQKVRLYLIRYLELFCRLSDLPLEDLLAKVQRGEHLVRTLYQAGQDADLDATFQALQTRLEALEDPDDLLLEAFFLAHPDVEERETRYISVPGEETPQLQISDTGCRRFVLWLKEHGVIDAPHCQEILHRLSTLRP